MRLIIASLRRGILADSDGGTREKVCQSSLKPIAFARAISSDEEPGGY